MIRKIKPSPFISDIVLTTATSIIVTLSIIVMMRLLARGLGAESFGAYLLARMILTVASPFSTFAIGVGLARYVVISKDSKSKNKYLLSGLVLGVIPSLIVLIIGLIFKNNFTLLIFHNSIYSSLLIATLFMIVGYSFYNVLYSFYRGMNQMGRANLWQLGVMSIGPIIITFSYAKSGRTALIIFLMGACFFIALLPLLSYCIKAISQNMQGFRIRLYMRKLFNYSLPRVPAGIGLSGIFFIGPFLAPYIGSLKEAGYLVIGQSMLGIVESGVSAFGIVALPKIADLYAGGRSEFLRERIADIITLVFHLGLFATLHLFLWADQIVLIWLGNQYIAAIPVMRIMLLVLIPYLAYIMLRSIIDAVEVKAINTFNLYLSLAVTLFFSLVFFIVGFGIMGFAAATAIGFFTLGVLTILYLKKIYRFNSNILRIKEILILNIIFICVAFILKYYFAAMFKGIMLIGIALFLEGVLFFLYYMFLRKLKIRWICELENRIIKANISGVTMAEKI